MRRIILSRVACPTLPYFPTLSNKRHDFRKKYSTKYVFLLSLKILSETFLILEVIQRGIVIAVHRQTRKVPVILLRF